MLVEQQNTLKLILTGREIEVFQDLVRLAFHSATDCSEVEELAAIIMNKIEDV